MRREPTTCLFCGSVIPPPQEEITEIGEVIYGRCECGAIYVCEPTGHNQGEALVQAMLLVSPEGIDKVELGVNFELRERDYNYRTHKYVYIHNWPFSGRLFFLKALTPENNKAMEKVHTKITKKDFIRLVENREFEQIKKIVVQNKNSLGWLISLSYDKESLISWKAIEAMGWAAEAFIEAKDTETLRNTIRKLLWSMSDESGGVGWRAAEMIGEIIYAEPSLFEDIIPILWSQREEESFLESVFRSILKLSHKIDLSEYIKINCQELESLLKHKNNQIKGLSAILIMKARCNIPLPEEAEKTHISIYKNGQVITVRAEEAKNFL